MTATTRISQTVALSSFANLSRQNSRNSIGAVGGPTRRATTIGFSGSTISDSGNGLALFGVGGLIEVQGSASNNRIYRVTTSAAGALDVTPALTTESAGALVTVKAY